jgi:hypothetical protein
MTAHRIALFVLLTSSALLSSSCHLWSDILPCWTDEDCPDSACDLEMGVCEGGEGEGE